uniref:Uncharacterized protein n=1 Tax=Avena sativa TaxID=4498 RepID=A0ACD5TDA3_AVESA
MWPPEYAASGKQAPVVVDVWADNEEEELAHISRGLLVDFPIAVVATYQDLPARPLRDAGHLAFHDNVYHVVHSPRHTLEHHCRVLQDRIRGVRFFQLVLALLDRDGAVALGRVWRFHVGAPLPADDRLLLELGVEPPARRRVHRDHIGTALKGCNAIHNTAVTWVTCDGADDVCHLMSCFDDPEIVRQVSSRMNFVRNSRSFFPQLYDLRFLAEWRTLAGEEPPLAAAARAGAPAALLHGFLALMKEPTFAEQMEGYNGILFGIGHLDTPDVVNRHKMSREERQRRYRMEFCRKRC